MMHVIGYAQNRPDLVAAMETTPGTCQTIQTESRSGPRLWKPDLAPTKINQTSTKQGKPDLAPTMEARSSSNSEKHTWY